MTNERDFLANHACLIGSLSRDKHGVEHECKRSASPGEIRLRDDAVRIPVHIEETTHVRPRSSTVVGVERSVSCPECGEQLWNNRSDDDTPTAWHLAAVHVVTCGARVARVVSLYRGEPCPECESGFISTGHGKCTSCNHNCIGDLPAHPAYDELRQAFAKFRS